MFIANRQGDPSAILWPPAEGSGAAERLTDPKVVQPSQLHVPLSHQVTFAHSVLSPDGRWIDRREVHSHDDRRPRLAMVSGWPADLATGSLARTG
jgi:hypothetical protein